MTPKTNYEPKRSHKLLDAITRAKIKKREQRETPLVQASKRNVENLNKARDEFFNK